MPDYLLPCDCGHKTAVSSVQAGETVRCVCGAALVVPSMRGLRALETAEPAPRGRRGSRRWEDRHRAAFVLLVAAAVCLGIIAYMALTLPAGSATEPPQAGPMNTVFDAFREYVLLDYGIAPPPVIVTPDDKTRGLMLWGMGLVGLLALGALAGAAAILFRAPRRK
jgi:hypothetical protein